VLPLDIVDGMAFTAFASERNKGSQNAIETSHQRDLANTLTTCGTGCNDSTNLGTNAQNARNLYNICRTITTSDVVNGTNGFDLGTTNLGYDNWHRGYYFSTFYNHMYTPNAQFWDCCDDCGFPGGPGDTAIVTARSYHPGGVNVLMGDGQVRFVSNNVEEAVWRAIATRNGQEKLDNTAF
jgi:prepilin-type processing-associated H-X9-DG protein